MKKNLVIKAIIAMLLIFSVVSGSTGMIAHAASNTLKAGVYTVGKNLSPGLNKFTVSDGSAVLYVDRGEYTIIEEYLDSENYEYSNQFIANLKNGDIVEITKGSSPVKVESISKIDLKKVSNGFYEVGTDIPAGTYTLNLDNPAHEYDEAYISVFDKNYDDIEYNIIAPEDKPTHTFNKGDKVYVYFMIGTMSFTQKVITPTSITLNKSSLSLKVDQSAKLTATVKPDNATNKGINWSSTNTSVATVDANGNVKTMKAGNATITATAKGDTAVKKSISVTVTKIVPTSIKLSKSTLNITKNQSIKVTATVSPDNAADKTVQWKSSNTKVATVDAKGNIKGIANGKATITATAKDNTKV
ncbi:MAG TPA: Ig-like domain-containing protein, partial [Niallia sp.]|nr:Ig-like domain-containing protein [Niallia sp.]